MIRSFLILLALILLAASCSAPRYTYNFDYYDYNSGKKSTDVDTAIPNETGNGDKNPLALDETVLTASADDKLITIDERKTASHEEITKTKTEVASPVELARKYKELSKTQRKAFRKAMREDMRRYVIPSKKSNNDVRTVTEAKAMDRDLKMAIIFGAVGVTLSLFGGVNQVFWILSVISIVVGLVFLIKWLSRQ
jgi:hypothetical protein